MYVIMGATGNIGSRLASILLDKDEKRRLGAGGCEEIMAHPYFKNVN